MADREALAAIETAELILRADALRAVGRPLNFRHSPSPLRPRLQSKVGLVVLLTPSVD